jgi:hypothetical protein
MRKERLIILFLYTCLFVCLFVCFLSTKVREYA